MISNHLVNENSPYLLQHKNNPVDWYPWGTEAFDRAHQEDKPIFLSIGYSACHWCHVMAHESFEDSDIAEVMNKYFINIKVDREERPDIDNIYMSAVVAMTGQGGWPTSVFLTPNGEPFFGGTYFPPMPRHNLPSFLQVLMSVASVWENDKKGIVTSANKITEHLKSANLSGLSNNTELHHNTLEETVAILAENYDWKYGGWGQAPKFPQPMVIEFLLHRSLRGDQLSHDMALHALNAMMRGGIYDVIGGGFSRYSTDEQWCIPHFEKMLYDNALLARTYLHAYLITRQEPLLRVCMETLDFILREMTHPLGGFFSSLDADSEGEEGKYYLWERDEIIKLLGEDAPLFISAYNITESGNFEGKTVLQRALTDSQLAQAYNLNTEEIQSKLFTLHHILHKARSNRIRPITDEKILVSWNGLMLIAFAEAGRYLKVKKYTEVAIRNAEFLLDNMVIDQRLYRSWHNGKAMHAGCLEDYASLGLALITLYQSDPNPRWFSTSKRLAEKVLLHFHDPAGGFFDTPNDHERLIFRPKNIQDNATPSGNALATTLLAQLSIYTGNNNWRTIAQNMLANIESNIIKYPTAFAQWLSAYEFLTTPTKEIAILGNPYDEKTCALIKALWSSYDPFILAAISDFPPPQESPELLISRKLVNDQPTTYVCRNFVCTQPSNTVSDFLKNLKALY